VWDFTISLFSVHKIVKLGCPPLISQHSTLYTNLSNPLYITFNVLWPIVHIVMSLSCHFMTWYHILLLQVSAPHSIFTKFSIQFRLHYIGKCGIMENNSTCIASHLFSICLRFQNGIYLCR